MRPWGSSSSRPRSPSAPRFTLPWWGSSAGHAPSSGRFLEGPCDLNRLGIGRTFQLLQVFPQLSVRENLVLAGQEHQGGMWSRLFGPRDAGLSAAANRMIDFFRLAALADERAGSLSYGQQKLLDVAMAFMAGPRPGALAEPPAGAQPAPPRRLPAARP